MSVDFGTALAHMWNGASIARPGWKASGRSLAMRPMHNHISEVTPNGDYSWIPTQEDILADDWEVRQ